MPVLITGATGFIGRHLVDALASAGDEVHALSRAVAGDDSRPNVIQHRVDYNRSDLGLTDDVLREVDVVYHLAGATRAVSAKGFRDANVGVTERLLDRLASVGSKARFVLVSSQAAAGPAMDAEHPRVESDPEAPIEDYGRSKLAAERAVRARAEIEHTIIRPVAVYGGADRDFLSIFSMAKRGVAVYPGLAKSSINTIYVKDLVAGMIAAATSPAAIGNTYFLGDDRPQPWREIYQVIAETVGNPQPLELRVPRAVIAAAGAVGDLVGALSGRPSLVSTSKATLAAPKYWLCSSGKAHRDFGFSTPTSLRDGMQATYDWYLRHRWL